MAFTLVLLGQETIARTVIAIAVARSLAARGQRVLLVGDPAGPGLAAALGLESVATEPQSLGDRLSVVQPTTSHLLDRGWQEVKALEARYLRQPFFKEVFGEELPVLPGLDQALMLNALRQYDESGQYEAIVYTGASDRSTLLMLGLPEVLAWYVRRFTKVVETSDFAKAISPFIQPMMAAVSLDPLSSFSAGQPWDGPLAELNGLLDRGRSSLANPQRLAAWLVTDARPEAIASSTYLWGCAQQAGVSVGGVLAAGSAVGSADSGTTDALNGAFSPLAVTAVTIESSQATAIADWPDFGTIARQAPHPIDIDLASRQVRLFLPGFTKAQIKLVQSGPELTIEAGDQRRNLLLPPPLAGRAITGAKFSDRSLIISL